MSDTDENQNLLWKIDESWSNNSYLGLRGWIVHPAKKKLDKVDIVIGDIRFPVTSWHSRPDVVSSLPFDVDENCGFWVQIPRDSEEKFRFEAKVDDQIIIAEAELIGAAPAVPAEFNNVGGLFEEFVKYANTNKLSVLEIGSRIVGDYSTSKRDLFAYGAQYTGFDYHPDANTDVVGDAHKLSSYFKNKTFDAIFSLSVFEHLAMPWLVAMEINKLLKNGGVTYHSTHFSWPLHETPWDFWRFSDEGLKVLFSEPLGFEVKSSGFFNPLRMHLDGAIAGQEALPLEVGFAGVAILASKKGEIDSDRFRWETDVDEVLSNDSHYPLRE